MSRRVEYPDVNVPIIGVQVGDDMQRLLAEVFSSLGVRGEQIGVISNIVDANELLDRGKLPESSIVVIKYDKRLLEETKNFLRKFRTVGSRHEETPIVVIGAYDIMEAKDACQPYGIHAFFEIPLDIKNFRQEIASLLMHLKKGVNNE